VLQWQMAQDMKTGLDPPFIHATVSGSLLSLL